jgi:translation initiation factor IF-2
MEGRVRAGTECGIGVRNYNDIRAGDQIACFARVEIARNV